MNVVRDDLWLCVDCLMVAVNGDASGLDYSYGEEEAVEKLAAIEAGLERLGAHLVPDFDSETGEGHEEFSARGCDCCLSHLAGELHRFAILGDAPRVTCDDCDGNGQSFNDEGNLDGGECETCGGNGDVPDDESQLSLTFA